MILFFIISILFLLFYRHIFYGFGNQYEIAPFYRRTSNNENFFYRFCVRFLNADIILVRSRYFETARVSIFDTNLSLEIDLPL